MPLARCARPANTGASGVGARKNGTTEDTEVTEQDKSRESLDFPLLFPSVFFVFSVVNLFALIFEGSRIMQWSKSRRHDTMELHQSGD